MDPLVVAIFGLVSALEIGIPFIIGFFIVRRYNVPWSIFGWGALFFILIQVIHTPLVIGIQSPLYQFLIVTFPGPYQAIAIFSIVLGLLAGLFEEIGRYLVYKYIFPRRPIDLRKENGLQFGIGWGGIESMAVGGIMILTMLSYIVAVPLTSTQIDAINKSTGGILTDEQIALIRKQNETLLNLKPLDLLPSLIERIMTITLHLAWSLMVLAAVVQKRTILLATTILWHTVADAVAVFLGQTAGILAAEMAVFVMALIGIWYIREQGFLIREKNPRIEYRI